MKKLLAIVLIGVMAFSLVSCKDDKKSSKKKQEKTTQKILYFPDMTKENEEYYEQYVYPYEATYMCMFNWGDGEYTDRLFWDFFLVSVGQEEYRKTKALDDDNYFTLTNDDMKEIKALIKAKFVVDDKDIEQNILNGSELQPDGSYKAYPFYGGCGVDHVVTDSKLDGDILTLEVCCYYDTVGEEFPTNKDGYMEEDKKGLLKIKLEDNGDFKFISNTMIKE